MGTDEVSIRLVGSVGRITLTRPQALNALNHAMANAIDEALERWEHDGAVRLVLIDAEGSKAFCAGGDIAAVHASGIAGEFEPPRQFWVDEYRLNAHIAHYRLPYVALMDGIVMGGGVGISAHGSHRIVTERSLVAMPECGIGLVPDVGGTWLLSKAPGHLGEFLGLTGWRMSGADAIMAGFADSLVPSAQLAALTGMIEATGDVASIADFAQEPEEAPLSAHRDAIDRHFSKDTVLECLLSLEADPSEFARKAATLVRRASPLSVASTFTLIRRARHLVDIEQALAAEYRFTYRSMTEAQFLEGIRAQIIDKDRNPRWQPDRLEEVTADAVDRVLAPLGTAELRFPKGATT